MLKRRKELSYKYLSYFDKYKSKRRLLEIPQTGRISNTIELSDLYNFRTQN
ncbi:hypothetical protein bsdtb5_14070 [Anaeromicropila herbilytica]|uniref:Uncharacterized protein n=1 Tax=Anaeromicropila herbilytica TaxID=2785025 RepID=A0A7R7IC09_9FIRM|nr:hypothetical protein bsdtb5_14070 [Anaeromicropila herbilytica]